MSNFMHARWYAGKFASGGKRNHARRKKTGKRAGVRLMRRQRWLLEWKVEA